MNTLQRVVVVVCLGVTALRAADTPPTTTALASQGWCGKAAARALEALAQAPETNTTARFTALMEAGQALQLADEADQALTLYEKAAHLARQRVKTSGTDDALRGYIDALIHLGATMYAKSQYESAEMIFTRALEAARLRFDEKEPLSRIARNRFAMAFGKRYQLEPSKRYYLALRQACLTTSGERDTETAIVLDELAGLFMITRDYPQAAEFAEESLKIWRRALRSKDPRLADAIARLASTYYELGRREELLPLLKEVLKIRLAAHGPEHPKTHQARENLKLIGR